MILHSRAHFPRDASTETIFGSFRSDGLRIGRPAYLLLRVGAAEPKCALSCIHRPVQ